MSVTGVIRKCKNRVFSHNLPSNLKKEYSQDSCAHLVPLLSSIPLPPARGNLQPGFCVNISLLLNKIFKKKYSGIHKQYVV